MDSCLRAGTERRQDGCAAHDANAAVLLDDELHGAIGRILVNPLDNNTIFVCTTWVKSGKPNKSLASGAQLARVLPAKAASTRQNPIVFFMTFPLLIRSRSGDPAALFRC